MNQHASPARPIEILLIEDNPGDVRLTREALRTSDLVHQINVIHDGDRALDFLFQRAEYEDAVRPDLILLDLNLPRRSGLEVLGEIKGNPDVADTPVIIFTSSKSEREINRSYELHANCFVTKPVGLDRFTEVVQTIEQFWLRVVHLPVR